MGKEVYELYNTRWIECESKIVPCILNNERTKLKIMDKSERIISNNESEIKSMFGKDAIVLSYEDICQKYDPMYDGNPSAEAHMSSETREELLRDCGNNTPDGLFPRYKFYNNASKQKLNKIAKYLMSQKENQNESEGKCQF